MKAKCFIRYKMFTKHQADLRDWRTKQCVGHNREVIKIPKEKKQRKRPAAAVLPEQPECTQGQSSEYIF